jgi:dihydroorotase
MEQLVSQIPSKEMKKTIIHNALLINEGKTFKGGLSIVDDHIETIFEAPHCATTDHNCHYIDAEGAYLLPGVIDEHVHFRDPGLTQKADLFTESCAAAAGGVTSMMDMPNVVPQTTTLETLEERFNIAQEKCLINHSFYFGATNHNLHLFSQLDPQKIAGIKLFMGASTGNMLVDDKDLLYQIFKEAPLLIATHCEDSQRIAQNSKKIKAAHGEEASIHYHPIIRDEQACYSSSALAVELAQQTGARLHLLHVTTAEELALFSNKAIDQKKITAEVCIPHLLFHQEDYHEYGAKIKCNPAIKAQQHQSALLNGLISGQIDTIATDHAPHLLHEKQGGCFQALSGIPMIQFSLIAMLDLADQQQLPLSLIVEKMCHAPAQIYNIHQRGYLRAGYKADLVLVSRKKDWTLTSKDILSKCQWSPLEGKRFKHRIEKTFVNGQLVFDQGEINTTTRGEALHFDRR